MIRQTNQKIVTIKGDSMTFMKKQKKMKKMSKINFLKYLFRLKNLLKSHHYKKIRKKNKEKILKDRMLKE